MRFTLIGGPINGSDEIPVPWPENEEPPPYLCTGMSEPFQHFVRMGENAVYIHAGECRVADHPQGYPHNPYAP